MNRITFSTLACPGWEIETVISNAAAFGYGGIEWRGGPQGHLHPSMTTAQKTHVRQRCADAGLISLAITAYTGFVSPSRDERQHNIDELCRYADLASEVGARYVRTFLGELPEHTQPDARIYENIVDCLRTAADYAQSVDCIIAVEPHDNFVTSSSLVPILEQIDHSALRFIWDIGNTFSAGENPAEGFALLKDHLAYVQVKDGRGRDPHWQLCSLGEGEVPLHQTFELLLANKYQGSLSVEWEYAWHPELAPPEFALPAALQFIRELMATTQPG